MIYVFNQCVYLLCLCLSVFILSLLCDCWQGKITSQVVNSGYETEMKLENIWVWGVTTGPSHVTVNGNTAKFQYQANNKVVSSLCVKSTKVKFP